MMPSLPIFVCVCIAGFLAGCSSEMSKLQSQANGGDAAAQTQLGQVYVHGNADAGVEPDAVKAEEWLGKAARQGHQPAQHALGMFYQSSDNLVSAYAWYSIAASPTNGLTTQLRNQLGDRMTPKQKLAADALVRQLKNEIH